MLLARHRTKQRRELRYNTALGVFNGIAFSLAEALSDANLVLTLFIRQLGASEVLVGLLPSLKNGGWLLPQLVTAGRIQGMRYKLPAYRRAALGRFIFWVLMTALVWFAAHLHATVVLVGFIVCYTLYNLAGGTAGLAFQDVVAKTIPTQRRGNFFGMRNLFGGLLAFVVAGPIVSWALARTSPFPFPANFGLLLTLSLLVIGPALWAFGIIHEPPTRAPSAPLGTRAVLRQIRPIMREHTDFRRFISARMLTRLASLADPFYVIYASEVLHVQPRMIGVYLAVRTIAAALSNIVWSRVVDRHGTRRLMLLTGVVIIGGPLWALATSLLAQSLSPVALGWLFGGVFLLIGLCIDGSSTAGMTYVLEAAPEDQRPVFIGIANTTLGLATFFPVIGGLMLGWFGYELVFGVGVIFGVLGLVQVHRLREPREVLAA